MKQLLAFSIISLFIYSCNQPSYDTIIRNGMVYDGNGGEPYKADIGIINDTIAFLGDLSNSKGNNEIEANGMAVSPGFINMLSWSPVTLLEDGNSQGDIRQGVTLEVFGEGESMGPLNPKMKSDMQHDQPLIKFNVDWNTLGE